MMEEVAILCGSISLEEGSVGFQAHIRMALRAAPRTIGLEEGGGPAGAIHQVVRRFRSADGLEDALKLMCEKTPQTVVPLGRNKLEGRRGATPS